MAILLADKIDFSYKGQKTLHINKRFKIARIYNNYKHLHTKWPIFKIYEAKMRGEIALQYSWRL